MTDGDSDEIFHGTVIHAQEKKLAGEKTIPHFGPRRANPTTNKDRRYNLVEAIV